MADDQRRQAAGDGVRRAAADQGVVGRGGEREEDGVGAQPLRHRGDAAALGDEALRGAAEQAADVAKTLAAGDEDGLAGAAARGGAGVVHGADALVARHQRVAHAGEGRHAARPEQLLGAGADAAERHVHHHVGLARVGELDAAQRDLLRFGEQDGEGVQRTGSRDSVLSVS